MSAIVAASAAQREEALRESCRKGKYKEVEAHLKMGVHPDCPNTPGTVPLAISVEKEDTKSIKLLLAAKADVSRIGTNDDNTLPPISLAISKGFKKMFLDMVDSETLNIECAAKLAGQVGYTPLHYAAMGDHFEILNELLRRGADVFAVGSARKDTPLHAGAAGKAKAGVIKALAERMGSTKVNIPDGLGFTALHLAARENNQHAAVALLESGASAVAQVPKLLSTPLHIAASKGHSDIVASLIAAAKKNVSQLEMTDKDENTPLHVACASGHLKCAMLLLKAGVNAAKPRPRDGISAIHLALQLHKETMQAELAKYAKSSKSFGPIFTAIQAELERLAPVKPAPPAATPATDPPVQPPQPQPQPQPVAPQTPQPGPGPVNNGGPGSPGPNPAAASPNNELAQVEAQYAEFNMAHKQLLSELQALEQLPSPTPAHVAQFNEGKLKLQMIEINMLQLEKRHIEIIAPTKSGSPDDFAKLQARHNQILQILASVQQQQQQPQPQPQPGSGSQPITTPAQNGSQPQPVAAPASGSQKAGSQNATTAPTQPSNGTAPDINVLDVQKQIEQMQIAAQQMSPGLAREQLLASANSKLLLLTFHVAKTNAPADPNPALTKKLLEIQLSIIKQVFALVQTAEYGAILQQAFQDGSMALQILNTTHPSVPPLQASPLEEAHEQRAFLERLFNTVPPELEQLKGVIKTEYDQLTAMILRAQQGSQEVKTNSPHGSQPIPIVNPANPPVGGQPAPVVNQQPNNPGPVQSGPALIQPNPTPALAPAPATAPTQMPVLNPPHVEPSSPVPVPVQSGGEEEMFQQLVRATTAYEPEEETEMRLVPGNAYIVVRTEGDWTSLLWGMEERWAPRAYLELLPPGNVPKVEFRRQDMLLNENEVKMSVFLGRPEKISEFVFKAEYHRTPVVVKKIPVPANNTKERALSLVLANKEIEIMAHLAHPNILELQGWYQGKDGHIYIVTPRMQYGDVWHHLEANHDVAKWETFGLHIAQDVAAALVYLHTMDPPIIHGDLKTPNIVLSGSPDRYMGILADFGSVEMGDLIQKRIQPSLSLLWSAPEMRRGEPYTTAADIYSFGVVLWELCTGKKPWGGDASKMTEAGGVLELPHDCPPQLGYLIQECLQQDPDQRPTAEVIFENLKMQS